MSANANLHSGNKLIGCQRLTSTHKGCNRQSVMSRPHYEQIRMYDHDSASDKLSEERWFALSTISNSGI